LIKIMSLFAIKNNRSAFTLIEVIMVLFIISLGLVGVLALIVQNIQSQTLNKHNLVAYQLSQEGIELIRKVRDTNWAGGVDWNTGLAEGDYFMDYLDSTPQVIVDPNNEPILKMDSNGYYRHDLGSVDADTNFSRVIRIADQDAYSKYIIVTVSWGEYNRTHDYVLETILYDWK